MLFNSLEFLFFLPTVFIIYWSINRSLRLQNLLIVIASYIFYGWWDWRFLSLIIISSACDYLIGLGLYRASDRRSKSILLFLSLSFNLGMLGFFKYFNFFVSSFAAAFAQYGIELNTRSLSIVLPVGISFYTFQTLSYTIDVYKGRLKPTEDVIAFFAFVCFFPQLVAGPIERAANLLPQFYSKRRFDYNTAADGLRQILWGMFKKVVIAKICAENADYIFGSYNDLSSAVLVFGAVCFAFQIYGDFSGYSDIAIGAAKLFGFRLMVNFSCPYFARNIAEFWRRWHISLSTWFRDYVYIPLGGSYGSILNQIRNILITFTASGLWHGANWTFIVWGFLNGLYYIPGMLMHRRNIVIISTNKYLNAVKEFISIVLTFSLISFAWIFFRAEDISHAFSYIGRMCAFTLSKPSQTINIIDPTEINGILVIIIVEWLQRNKEHGLDIKFLYMPVRWAIYVLITILALNYFVEQKPFIYFQF
ncbi:membrane protein involved in D-alanine export [Candidatus Magnetoovum chiemensis]|nr:membrane protein involved in D-alanine export [Candidatus Magnetoovum chiemensis]